MEKWGHNVYSPFEDKFSQTESIGSIAKGFLSIFFNRWSKLIKKVSKLNLQDILFYFIFFV